MRSQFFQSRVVVWGKGLLGTAVLSTVLLMGVSATMAGAEPAPRVRFSKSFDRALVEEKVAGTLIVKLEEGVRAEIEDGRLVTRLAAGDRSGSVAAEARVDIFAPKARSEWDVWTVQDVLDRSPGATLEPLFDVPRPLLDLLRRRGEERTGERLADLSTFYVLRLPSAVAEVTVRDLLALDAVETLYARSETNGPVDKLPPVTPDFLNSLPGQGYRGPGPAGIGIDLAWQQGLDGSGVTIADVEGGWHLAHEDLDHLIGQVPPVPLVPSSQWGNQSQAATDHGTATLGVLASGNNGYGTTGLVPGSKIHVVPTNVTTSTAWTGAHAVVWSTLFLQAGDVILIEAQILDSTRNFFVPFERDPAEYAAVRQATALGIHLIEPVGNNSGGLNLDIAPETLDPRTGGRLFNRYYRDSGAVLVGGGEFVARTDPFRPWEPAWHERYCNSNYGTRVDSYSWGHNVTTLGYGRRVPNPATCANPVDPLPYNPRDPDQEYTYCYNGSSSGGAIVAGAAAVLEQKHERDFGVPQRPRSLRAHLALGTRSLPPEAARCGSTAGSVGHQPDLDYALDFIDQGGLIEHMFEAEPLNAGQTFGPRLGWSVAGDTDVDGDGTPDLVVGAPEFAVPSGAGFLADAGRVYVYSGATGRVIYTLDGAAAGDRLGHAVDGLGDINFDGYGDIVVGIPGADGAAQDAGEARIYTYSPVTGPVLMRSFTGATANEWFGAAVAGVGNVNPLNEPWDDVMIGAPGNGTSLTLPGRAVVVNIAGLVLGSFTGTQAQAEFGFAVAGAGDLDGDNLPDLLIGEPGFDSAQYPDAGAVHAFSSVTGVGIFRNVGTLSAGLFGQIRYGHSVDGAGDYDGDGNLDVVIGAPSARQAPAGFRGRVDVVTNTGALISSVWGGHARDHFGISVAGLGDFNGDGFDDVAAGSPSELSGALATRNGRVRVLLGARVFPWPPGFTQRVFWTLDYSTRWGWSVAAAGDVNGDGRPDIVTGEPDGPDGGRAFVFTSRPGPDPTAGQARLAAFVPAIEAHDVNGNGTNGGGTSPSTATLVLDAGPAWGGADYLVIGLAPNLGNLFSAQGQLDPAGRTAAPFFGPFPSGNPGLCQLVGFRQKFLSAALRDTDGDGIWDIFLLSNVAEVEIMNEYFPVCR